MKQWDDKLMDLVLSQGNRQYLKSRKHSSDECNPNLKIDEIEPFFYLNEYKVTMSTKGTKTEGLLFASEQTPPLLHVGLKNFFENHPSGIFSVKNKHFGVWKDNTG